MQLVQHIRSNCSSYYCATPYFTSNGYAAVYRDGGWDVCSNDMFGATVAALTGGWTRVSLSLDYGASNAAVVLDGRLLREAVPFAGADASACRHVRYVNANDVSVGFVSNAYVDAVLVGTNLPPGLEAGGDGDNDGMAEAAEIHLFGNTTNYHRPVVTVSTAVVGVAGQDPGAVAPAGTFDVMPGSATNLSVTANIAFLVTDIRTNGVSVGAFPGSNTRTASWSYASITQDTAIEVEFTYTALRAVPADYGTLGAAVAAALSNDTVTVAGGTYALASPVIVSVPLTLVGDTNAPANVVLQAPVVGDDRDIFQVRASDVTIRGFRMTGVTNGTAPGAGWVNAAIMVGNDGANALMDSPGALEGLTNGLFEFNEYAGCAHGAYLYRTVGCQGRQSSLAGCATGVWADAVSDWRSNWWGAVTGPAGAGFGSGAAVSSNVLFEPWWTDAAGSQRGFRADEGDTLADVFAAAADGDTVVVPAGSYAGDVTLGHSVTLLGGDFVVDGRLTFEGAATVTGIGALQAQALAVADGQAATVSGGSLTVTGLTVGAGATLTVVGGTLVVGDTTLTGTFTLDETWGPGVVARPLPFQDGFELYGAGQRLDRLGPFGWMASATSVVVQTATVHQGTKAVAVPMGTALSNALAGAAASTNLWTDLRLIPPLGLLPAGSPGDGESVRLCFTTNGYVAVATNGGWDVCSADAAGYAVPAVSSTWVRLSLHHDFDARRVAVLLDGRVLRGAVPFPGGSATDYHRLQCRNAGTSRDEMTAYLDAVSIGTNFPGGLELGPDTDQDNMADALEIHRYGDLSTHHPVPGVIFTFR